MSNYFFNKYTALAIGVQFTACLLVWIVAFAISPAGDSFFGLMFYFYLPAIFLVSTVLGLRGESGMIAAGVYGIAFGILLYGVIFGIVMSYLKSRR
jgi:hypothetical protein